MNQCGIFGEQLLQARNVAGDNGIDGGLEALRARAGVCERIDVRGKFRPAREAMRTRDDELRVGQATRCAAV